MINMFNVIAGHDSNDSNTSTLKLDNDLNKLKMDKIKIGYSQKIFNSLDPKIQTEFSLFIDFLKSKNIILKLSLIHI